MREALALVSYGLLLLTDIFLIVFWGRTACRRIKELGSCAKARHDKYAMIAVCLTLTSAGTGLIFVGGLIAFTNPNDIGVAVASMAILIGIVALAVAKSGFVWTIDLRKDSWIWRAFIGLSLLWVALAILWVWVDPLNIYPVQLGG